MDLAVLKDLLGDQYDALETYVNTLIGQRDAARKESIDGRKALKAENEALKAAKATLFEKLGLDDETDLATLPDAKGQAEAVKQFEARVKRLEKDLADTTKQRDDGQQRYRQVLAEKEMQKALAHHAFVDQELVEDYVKSRLVWDDDALMYRHGETPMALDEGVKLLVKDRPHLLKQAPAGGSGWNPTGQSSGSPDPNTLRQQLRAQVSSGNPAAKSA